ncbi:MAG TPA: hypothetical protein VFX92_00205 [Candidatus Krumholzibacteria bacterium]|nr:hypothetical protein [Candidatus Krumholzibacteria bacterium]
MHRHIVFIAAALLAVLAVRPAAAQLELHGFVEAAGGARLSDVGPPPAAWGNPGVLPPVWSGGQDYLLREARLQLKGDLYGSAAEAHFVTDMLADQVAGDVTELILREGWIKFNAFHDHMEVRAGRQPTTWGTGDLLFINDLFPKDYVSFFIGRDDQYLKSPSDAVRLGWFGLPLAIDLVYTPVFAPNVLPTGERLVFWSPAFASAVAPEQKLENGETALRLSRDVGRINLALYGYWGFWKNPMGFSPPDSLAGTTPSFYHPALNVYGASVRGGMLGGVAWAEGGWYDSADDRDGVDPFVPNSETRAMAGYERQWWSDFTGGAQVYWEGVQDYHTGEYVKDENYTLVTLRLMQMLRYQTVKLSAFTFYSPSDEDAYVRLSAGYDYTDELNLTLGANLFQGNDERTLFGMNEDNSNAFLRVRYNF